MPKARKPPFNPVAPLYGKIPDLEIPSDLFPDDGLSAGYESEYCKEPEFIVFARSLYNQVRVNGKGKVLFKNVDEFLNQLDAALSYFEAVRSLAFPDDAGDLNAQREYFKRLTRATEALNSILSEMKETHSRRLAHAGFVLPQRHTGKGVGNTFIKQVLELERASKAVREDLSNRKMGRFAELFLLIEQLADMHPDWPTLTQNHHNPENRGVFFELVNAIYPAVGLVDAELITPNSIVDGIMLAQKT